MQTLANSEERGDARARAALRRHRRLPGLPRATAPARGAGGDLRGRDIAELSALPLRSWRRSCRRRPSCATPSAGDCRRTSGETTEVAVTIARDLRARIDVLLELGLGYLSIDRATPTLSPGELQRLRIATQLRSGLFGVVYVLDEPSAGLHPADAEPLLAVLEQLKAAGNSLFVVEHDLDVVRRADWIVDVGPALASAAVRCSTADRSRACRRRGVGRRAGTCSASAARAGARRRASPRLAAAAPRHSPQPARRRRRPPARRLDRGHRRLGLGQVDARQPGAGELVARWLGGGDGADERRRARARTSTPAEGVDRARDWRRFDRLVHVDQKPIGRTPRSNLADLHGPVRRRAQGCSPHTAGGTRRAAGARAASPSTCAEGAARPAKAKASCRSSCCSCPAPTRRARPATARATTPRRSRCSTASKTIAEVLAMTVDEAA